MSKEEAIKELERLIKLSKENNDDERSSNWRAEEGVLLTRYKAQQIVNLLNEI